MWFLIPVGFFAAAFGFRKLQAQDTANESVTDKIFGPFQPVVNVVKDVTTKAFYGPPNLYGPPTQNSIDQVALGKARAKLIEKEGYRNDAYLDHLGVLTIGIGHKVLPGEYVFGQKISDAQVEALFAKDVSGAFSAARTQAIELQKYTADFVAALTLVNFQLGTGWRNKFPNTWKYLVNENYEKAIANLRTSAWYAQTPDRVAAFITAIQTAYT